MPTGAGKSLTYQLPAVMLQGTCVVVSPLIALMHDQLRAANANGIAAAALTSVDMDREATIERFRSGELDLLDVAPERASQAHFRELLTRAPIALFAIDEAICVSELGHDFRPDYRLLRPLLDRFGDVPTPCAHRYADQHTRADPRPARHSGRGPDHCRVRPAQYPRPHHPARQSAAPAEGTVGRAARPGIVYAPTRNRVESWRTSFLPEGAACCPITPGWPRRCARPIRRRSLPARTWSWSPRSRSAWRIDKPDVRFVAHAG